MRTLSATVEYRKCVCLITVCSYPTGDRASAYTKTWLANTVIKREKAS